MFYSELSKYQRRRFIQRQYCPLCGNRILKIDSFVMRTQRISHSILYSFYHNCCYERSVSNGEKIKKVQL